MARLEPEDPLFLSFRFLQLYFVFLLEACGFCPLCFQFIHLSVALCVGLLQPVPFTGLVRETFQEEKLLMM